MWGGTDRGRARVHSGRRFGGWVLLSLLFSACAPDLVPPPDAIITCGEDGVCPEGMSCRDRIRRCISDDNQDQQAPAILGLARIPVTRLAEGDVLEVGFTVSERLFEPPTLALTDSAGTELAMVPDAEVRDSLEGDFVFRHLVVGDEAEGAATAQLEMVDAVGNEGRVELGQVTVDFTGPTGTLAWEASGAVHPDDAVRVTGQTEAGATLVSATLTGTPGDVRLDVRSFLTLDPADGALTGGLDLPTLALGSATSLVLEVALTDDLGNPTQNPVRTGTLLLDATPPTVTVDSGPPALTTELSATITFSSPATDLAGFSCSLDGAPPTPCTSPATFGLGDTLALGDHAFSVWAEDLAGNVSTASADHTWTIERRWASVDGGSGHVCAVATDHTLWCWGSNYWSQLGDGTQLLADLPREVVGHRWASVTVGAYITCAIDLDGALWCWGLMSGSGPNGTGVENPPVPAPVGTATDWSRVAAYYDQICGLRGSPGSATLWCWGDGLAVGQGVDDVFDYPTRVGSAADWVDVAVGFYQSCALDAGGEIWCWGRDTFGALGVSTSDDTTGTPTPLAFTGHTAPWRQLSSGYRGTVAIDDAGAAFWWGGALSSWGTDHIPVPLGPGTGWTEATTGAGYACGVDGGVVRCLGAAEHGELGDGRFGVESQTPVATGVPTPVKSLGLGNRFGCAITEAGAMWCWGSNDAGTLGQGTYAEHRTPTALDAGPWAEVAGSDTFTCAIRTDGGLDCWGFFDSSPIGQYLPGPTTWDAGPGWTDLTAGKTHHCALNAGGLYCWGNNQYGQTLGYYQAGDVTTPTRVGADADWVQVGAGGWSTCGVRNVANSGQGWCVGRNRCGQMGTGATSTREPLVQLPGSDWVQLAPADWHTCGIQEATNGDRSLWCWGANDEGQAGVDPTTTATVLTPAQADPFGALDWQQVVTATESVYSCTGGTTCGIRGTDPATRTVACMGRLDQASSVPLLGYQPVPILGPAPWAGIALSAGSLCAWTTAGQVTCLGRNDYGKLGRGTINSYGTAQLISGLSPVQVAGNPDDTFFAIDGSGALWGWGHDDDGNMGLGTWASADPLEVVLP